MQGGIRTEPFIYRSDLWSCPKDQHALGFDNSAAIGFAGGGFLRIAPPSTSL